MIPRTEITEIGELVGYHNCSYFIKFLSRKTDGHQMTSETFETETVSEREESDLC